MDTFAAIVKYAWGMITRPDIGAFASLLGTFISIYVGFTVRDIRRKVLFKSRAPALAQNLKQKASNLSELMQNYEENTEQIHVEIALAHGLLKSAAPKLSGTTKSTIKHAMNQIDAGLKNNSSRLSRDSARGIYTQLLVSVQAIENLIEDTNQEP